jgi:hypothetical protein
VEKAEDDPGVNMEDAMVKLKMNSSLYYLVSTVVNHNNDVA